MTYKGGERIGSSIGEILIMDVDEDGVGWEKYLRIRVNVDTIKPLP